MCCTVFYRYACRHHHDTTFQCRQCPDGAPHCPELDFRSVPLDEPCHGCSSGGGEGDGGSSRGIFDSAPVTAAEVQLQRPVVVWRGASFVCTLPLRTRRLVNILWGSARLAL